MVNSNGLLIFAVLISRPFGTAGYETTRKLDHRLALTEEAAGADNTAARRKLGEWQEAARDFTAQTGIARDSARDHVGTSGSQPRGMMPQTDATVSKAKTLFPKDTFPKVGEDIYASSERIRLSDANKNERAKFDKELAQAKLFTDAGHTVVLVAENNSGKNYDAIMDGGQSLELKTVTGGLKKVGANFKDGIEKADNVFIRTSGKNPSEIYSKLVGEVKTLLENGVKVNSSGSVFLWIDEEKKMRRWTVREIIEAVKKLL